MNIDDFTLGEIVKQIRKKACVPFLGAGVNIPSAPRYSDGLPTGAELTRRMFEKLPLVEQKKEKIRAILTRLGVTEEKIESLVQEKENQADKLAQLSDEVKWKRMVRLFASYELVLPKEMNLARLSMEFETRVGRPRLDDFLREEIPDEQRQPSPLLRVLAEMPFSLIVTTNYDRLMEKALQEAGKVEDKDFKVIVQHFDERFGDYVQRQLSGFAGQVLYKIHGSFPRDGQEGKLVITEDDYIELLTYISPKYQGIPPLIASRLEDTTLLFFGYSLEDWDFRVIYKSLVESRQSHEQEMSYAFQKETSQVWERFWDRKNITIFNDDQYDIAEKLRRAYQAEVKK